MVWSNRVLPPELGPVTTVMERRSRLSMVQGTGSSLASRRGLKASVSSTGSRSSKRARLVARPRSATWWRKDRPER